MRKLSNRILAVAAAGTLLAAGFGVSAVMAAYSGNDAAAHLSSSSITNAECIGCHGNRTFEQTLDTATFSAHKRHLYSAYLRFTSLPNGCGVCHVRTDIEQSSGATVNKQVASVFCASCHGVFPKTAHGGTDWAVLDPRSCTRAGCHTAGGANDPAAAHAAAGYVNTFFASSRTYCIKCHGGIKLFVAEETN